MAGGGGAGDAPGQRAADGGGGGVFIAACLGLGRRLTPLPFPKESSSLVQTGVYAIVRHPIYSGGLVLAIGWAFRTQSWLTLGTSSCCSSSST